MRVLGLDITQHGVFGVEVETAFGRFEIRDTHEILFDSESSPGNALNAAQQMVQSLHHKTERLVIGLPSELFTFRNIHLATKDRKAIKSALEFELEDDLPFEKDNLHYDYAILSANQQGSTIHVGATQKESFENYLNQLTQYGIDADIITTDTWAYRSTFSRIYPKAENSPAVMLVGIEDEKTFFYIHQDQKPILYREISFGSKTIENTLKSTFNAASSEVKLWINNLGLTSNADEKVAGVIADALDVLISEIKQTELAARATIKGGIDQIFITGEIALMPGLINWLESASQKRVNLFQPLNALSPAKLNYSEVSEVRFAKALSLAMTTLPLDKVGAINLRKGAYGKANSSDNSMKDLISKILPYAALVTLVFTTTKAIEYQYYQGKLGDTEDTLKKAVKNYFGGPSDGAVRAYMADTSKLKKMVQADLTRERELSKLFAQNPNSPIDFLKNISNKVGKDIVLDVVNFSAGADANEPYRDDRPLKAALTVMISNPQLLARLTEVLEKSYGLKRSSSDEVSKEGRKLYKVEYSGVIAPTKGGR